ncbi:hypothetical protein GQX74_015475 [Glossina fuscipes]|nr:hypothetical protein GQX74_015475 [Glossina fuscipes]
MKDYRLFFLATLGLYTAYTETEALVTSAGSVALAAQTPNGLQCQRITVSACQGLGYNMTAMPNLAGHTNQLEAELRVSLQISGHFRKVFSRQDYEMKSNKSLYNEM